MAKGLLCQSLCTHTWLFNWPWFHVESVFGCFCFFCSFVLPLWRFACAWSVRAHALWQPDAPLLISGPWFWAYEAELSLTLHFPASSFSNIYHFSSFLLDPPPSFRANLVSLLLFCPVMHLSFCVSRDSLYLLSLPWLVLFYNTVAFTCTRSPVSISLTYFSYYCHPLLFPPTSLFCRLVLQNGMFYTSYVSTYLTKSSLNNLILFNLLSAFVCGISRNAKKNVAFWKATFLFSMQSHTIPF